MKDSDGDGVRCRSCEKAITESCNHWIKDHRSEVTQECQQKRARRAQKVLTESYDKDIADLPQPVKTPFRAPKQGKKKAKHQKTDKVAPKRVILLAKQEIQPKMQYRPSPKRLSYRPGGK